VAKLPDKIDDWTPPWEKSGKTFDAEVAKGLIFVLMKSEQALKAARAALDAELVTVRGELGDATAKLSTKPVDNGEKDAELSTLRATVAKLTKDGRPEDQSLISRLRVASDHGLTAKDAERLVGDTEDELTEDAIELAERLGVGGGGNGNGDGEKPPAGPVSRSVIPAGNLANGRDRPGEAPRLVTAEEFIAGQAAMAPGTRGLTLAPLGR
jgi:hypothetical protein